MRSGLLVLDKPGGLSSRDCVNRIQRAVGDRRLKIGHAGTLDPMATGVLLVAIGEATRLVETLHDLDKAYSAEFEFGKSSDTLDREGDIELCSHLPLPNRSQIDEACRQWTGTVHQRPPRYSAIKINGRRAYDLARGGADFEPTARPVRIDSLTLTRFDYPHWSLDIRCGSGTYVRSIGRDVAEAVGNTAIMTALVRRAIGPFGLAHAHQLEVFDSPSAVESRLRSPVEGLVGWPIVVVDDRQAQALRHGQMLSLSPDQRAILPSRINRCAAVDRQGQLVALVDVLSPAQARPLRVFQTAMATHQPISTSARQSPES